MLILYALARPLLAGTNASESSLASVPDSSTIACDDIHGCRTVPGIIWSCVSVVFICTWVAIHPNVPRHGEYTLVILLQNAGIMFMALIAPELIVLWAMRQWFSARGIVKQFKKHHLSKTHAFFILMGGFALYDKDEFSRTLWAEGWNPADRRVVEEIYRRQQRDKSEQENTTTDITERYACLLEYFLYHRYVSINREEIQDRSHADIVSKTIAVVQTTWFVLQCIARGAQGLAVTELEIITLAFAFLTFITYFLWWNKPLRVRYPVRVVWRLDRKLPPRAAEHRATLTPRRPSMRGNLPGTHLASMVLGLGNNPSLVDEPKNTLPSWKSSVKTEILEAGQYIRFSFHEAWDSYFTFVALPLYPFLPLLVGFYSILMSEDDSLFFSQLAKDPPELYAAVYLIAVAFGSLHCVAWFFNFPTEVEQLQWRIISVLVAVWPLSVGVIHAILSMHKIPSISSWTLRHLSLITAIIYTVARIWLIMLALLALRDLPRSAYQAVQWLNFLPHIG